MTSDAEAAGTHRRFHADFWRAPAAIAAIGLDSTILSCNAAFAEILRADVDDLIGTDSTALVSPAEVEQAVTQSVTRMEGRTDDTRPQAIRMVRTDGTHVWVQFDSVLVDDDPDNIYVLATMTDVSAQVESQRALDRNDEWFRALQQHQSDIVTIIGFDALIHYISPNCERLLGFCADELIGTSGLDNIHPDDVDALVESLGAQLGGGLDAQPVQYRQRCRDGSWLWLEATGRQLPPELGVDMVIVNARDVSERRRADAAAREAELRFRNAFASSPLGIVFSDLDGNFTWVNQALAELLGESEAKLLEMSFFDLAAGDEIAREQHETSRLLRGEIESFTAERLYQRADGSVWTGLHFSIVRDAEAAPAQLLCQVEDITERKQREMVLTHDALHDPLTGLLNRAGLREHVDLAWNQRTSKAPVAVLFGDLDGFKHVNDTLGHDAGDEVLAHVVQRLRTAVRSVDVVARWGGDEFVVLCPTVADVEDATSIADRIRVALEAPFRVGPGLAEIGISVGVALDTGQPLPDLLIKDADAAAYRAKVQGRNCVVVA